MPPAELSELHHLFIHAMFLRRVAPYEKWVEVWKKSAGLIGARVSDNQFAQFYGEINEHIERFGFRIDITSDEGTGPIDLDSLQSNSSSTAQRPKQTKRWMALVNSRSDDTSKLGTEFNSNEISLYKKIIDRIILAANHRYCISYHEALRLSSTLQTAIKKSDAEKLLNVLVKKGWLSQSSTGYFSLSIRAKMELKSYINENYDEEIQPPTCASCRELVMRGFKCPNSECPKAMHVVCAMNQSRHSKTCPSCKNPFNYENLIGEDAVKGQDIRLDEEDEEEMAIQAATQPSQPRTKRTRAREDSDSEETIQSQSQPPPRRKSDRRR